MRTSHAIVAAAAALLLAGLVAARADIGSDPGESGVPSTSTPPAAASPPGTPSGTPSSDRKNPGQDAQDQTQPTTHTRAVSAAGVELEITARSVRIGKPRDDGTRRITVTGPPAYTTTTPGATVDEMSDRSVSLLRDGTPVAALTPVEHTEPSSQGPSSQDPNDGAQAPETRTLALGTDALDSARWAQRAGEGGRSLAVVPEAWVRSSGEATLDLLVAQLVAVAPEADSDTMRDQLTCHHIGAPDKSSWNVEPWRPDVGFFATAAARCNPSD